ncbi:PadR family transcriptional regulator [Anaeromicropila herbilytica]|uniref:Transcriptional regulator n=1 Tax=Anaeromicropila herbilytica TaxID=2785025 RepID=A0A7R7IDC5_9FIRM|nr:PadR family transcriptional regulator [Anaeromicropila herbilytica]BCN29873.1 transcriptional regulator [Anaeromicropila herbilytica]
MLTKPAILLLGMILESPKGAYEITKKLEQMQVRWWLKISDATVYSTIHMLVKKNYIEGRIEKNGNMPERTVYSITDEGRVVLIKTIRELFVCMDFDTTVFSVVASYAYLIPREEMRELLQKRLQILEEYKSGIHNQILSVEKISLPCIVGSNIQRMEDIVDAEILSANRMISEIGEINEK